MPADLRDRSVIDAAIVELTERLVVALSHVPACPGVLTPDQVCTLLQIKDRRLRELEDEGLLKPFPIGGLRRYRVQDVTRFIDEQLAKPRDKRRVPRGARAVRKPGAAAQPEAAA